MTITINPTSGITLPDGTILPAAEAAGRLYGLVNLENNTLTISSKVTFDGTTGIILRGVDEIREYVYSTYVAEIIYEYSVKMYVVVKGYPDYPYYETPPGSGTYAFLSGGVGTATGEPGEFARYIWPAMPTGMNVAPLFVAQIGGVYVTDASTTVGIPGFTWTNMPFKIVWSSTGSSNTYTVNNPIVWPAGTTIPGIGGTYTADILGSSTELPSLLFSSILGVGADAATAETVTLKLYFTP